MSLPELPVGWEEVRLNSVAEVRLGRQRSPDQLKGDYIGPYLRAANVTWGGLDLSDVKSMNFQPSEQETYRLRAGDVLLSEASGSASEVGKPAVWRDEIPNCCFQNTLIRVRSHGPLPEFLYYHFLHDARSGRFADAGKGIGINHLGAERMSSWPIRLAPLNEQRRIVAKIEELTDRSRRTREALDAVPALLDRFRQSVLAAAFRGDLTAEWRAKTDNLGTLEYCLRVDDKGWGYAKAESICEKVQSGSTPSADKFLQEGEIPFLKVYVRTRRSTSGRHDEGLAG